MLNTRVLLPSLKRSNTQLPTNQAALFAKHISTGIGTKLQTERISNIFDLRRVTPNEQYLKPELDIEHKVIKGTIETISHAKYIGIGIGSHGTADFYAEQIRKKGFILPKINNFRGAAQLGEGFYIAVGDHENSIAEFFALNTVEKLGLRSNNKNKKVYFPEILKIASPNFANLSGLIIPRAHHWQPIPWENLNTHCSYIKDFDYIVSFITMDAQTDARQWVQVKFNERALKYLEVHNPV